MQKHLYTARTIKEKCLSQSGPVNLRTSNTAHYNDQFLLLLNNGAKRKLQPARSPLSFHNETLTFTVKRILESTSKMTRTLLRTSYICITR